MDLRDSPIDITHLNVDEDHLLIVFDDFCGSGRTMESLFKGPEAPLCQLLNALPRARVFIGVIAGYREAFQKVLVHTAPFGDRVKLIPHRVFDESDKCFSEESQIFPNADMRTELEQFCKEKANACFPGVTGKRRLGFGGVGSLVVFPDTVPNNSLPILWYDNSDWIPLFPASGLLKNEEPD